MDRPLDAEEFLARVNSLLEIRSLCRRLREGKHAVEELLRRRTRESQESHLELLERLARVAELRDDPSGGHPGRVGRLGGLIAQELMLPAEETRCIMRAAPLHDLGNVGIPDDVVRLEGNFTEEQREQMREHTSLGAYLLHGAENERPADRGADRAQPSRALGRSRLSAGPVAHGHPHGGAHRRRGRRLRRHDPSRAVQGALFRPGGPGRDPARGGWQFDPEVVAALRARPRAAAGHAHHHAAPGAPRQDAAWLDAGRRPRLAPPRRIPDRVESSKPRGAPMPAGEAYYRGFEQGPIRPPSEARSLLIRVTRNCPWNRCRFCPVYKGTDFSRRPLAHVLADIEAVAAWVETFAPGRRAPPRPSRRAPPAALDPGAETAAWNWYRAG